MNRARFTFAATLVGASCLAVPVFAQTPPAALPMTPILAGKTFTPPFKGQADVDFTQPVTKNVNGMVTTTILVKNNVERAAAARSPSTRRGMTPRAASSPAARAWSPRPRGRRDRHDQDRDAVQPEDEGEQLQLHPRQRARSSSHKVAEAGARGRRDQELGGCQGARSEEEVGLLGFRILRFAS